MITYKVQDSRLERFMDSEEPLKQNGQGLQAESPVQPAVQSEKVRFAWSKHFDVSLIYKTDTHLYLFISIYT